MNNPFKVTEHEAYLQLTFHIPESSNALSLSAARELLKIQKRYSKWRKPVVVSSGHPTLFCSGGNLSDYAKLKAKPEGLKINREITAVLNAFAKWPAVKLALVDGDVLGGGMEWLARFDFRWSTPSAVFAFWQRRIGLTTGWGGGKAWADKIGSEQVRMLLTEGRVMSAEEALRARLVDAVYPKWKLAENAEVWSRGLGEVPVQAWRADRELKIFSSLWMGPSHRAALTKWKIKK